MPEYFPEDEATHQWCECSSEEVFEDDIEDYIEDYIEDDIEEEDEDALDLLDAMVIED